MIFIYKLHWNQSACERLGVARTLIVLLRDVDKDTNLQATLALRHLFESARCRNQFTDLGVFFSYVISYVNNIKMIKIMRFSYLNRRCT